MIAFHADLPGERAPDVAGRAQAFDDRREIPFRPPPEVFARQRIVVDAVDARKHAPAAPRIFVFPSRRAQAHDRRRIDAQARAILRQERRRRADDVFAEADRRRPLDREEMRVDDVLDRDAAKQIFVRLGVVVGIGLARRRIVVLFRKEARGPEHDRRQALVAVKQLAEVLGRGLGHAVDVLRDRRDALVDPGRGLTGRRFQRVAKRACRRGHDEGADASARRLLEQGQRAANIGLDEGLTRMGRDMRLVQRRGMQDRVDALHAARDRARDRRSSRPRR